MTKKTKTQTITEIPKSQHAGIIRNFAKRLAVVYRINPTFKAVKSRYIVVGAEAPNFVAPNGDKLTECVIDNVELIHATVIDERKSLTFVVWHTINGNKRVSVLHHDGKHRYISGSTTESKYRKHKPANTEKALAACGYKNIEESTFSGLSSGDDDMLTVMVKEFQEEHVERYAFVADDSYCAVSALEISIDRAIAVHFPKAIDAGINWSRGKRGDAQAATVTALVDEICRRIFTEAEIRYFSLEDFNVEALDELRKNYAGVDATSLHSVLLKHWCYAL